MEESFYIEIMNQETIMKIILAMILRHKEKGK